MEFIPVIFIGLLLGGIIFIMEDPLSRTLPDTFPDDKFLANWKSNSTPEIAKALAEIGKEL